MSELLGIKKIAFTLRGEQKDFSVEQVEAMIWLAAGIADWFEQVSKERLEEARDENLSWRDVARHLGIADGWEESAETMHKVWSNLHTTCVRELSTGDLA